MHITQWGPAFWGALHTAAYSYPRLGPDENSPTEEDKTAMKSFITAIGGVLPCKHCCNHYQQQLELESLDSAVSNREQVTQLIVRLHNGVNRSLGRTLWSTEDARRYWTEDGRSESGETHCPAFTTRVGSRCAISGVGQWVLVTAGAVLVAALGWMLYQCRKAAAGGRGGRRITIA